VDTSDDTAVVEAGADTAAGDIQDTASFSLNEQNRALPLLKTGQIQKNSIYNCLNKKRLNKPKNHFTLLSLYKRSGCPYENYKHLNLENGGCIQLAKNM
jgi:hypothetical protein